MPQEKIILLGAGNLGVHVGKALKKAGYSVVQVYSRTLKSAQELALEIDSEPITDLALLDKTASILLFVINDSALPEVLSKIEYSENQLFLHTSGSIPMDIFKEKAKNFGVLYPLQTFSKFRDVNFMDIPVFLEANSKENLTRIMAIARNISLQINLADSGQRQALHLSAVFMNNFVNHFYSVGNQVAKKQGCYFGFEVFKPLILETALKAIESGNPDLCQTGPAFRKNKEILFKHVDMLNSNPDLQNLYTFVTNNICKFYFNENII